MYLEASVWFSLLSENPVRAETSRPMSAASRLASMAFEVWPHTLDPANFEAEPIHEGRMQESTA